MDVCIVFLAFFAMSSAEETMCNDESLCPDNSTCCRLPSGDDMCCPYSNATCCTDGLHCCPQSLQCCVDDEVCYDGNTKRIGLTESSQMLCTTEPWCAYEIETTTEVFETIQCGEEVCENGATCCDLDFSLTIPQYCCPYKQDCCRGGPLACCPESYQCDVFKQCDYTPNSDTNLGRGSQNIISQHDTRSHVYGVPLSGGKKR